MFRGEKKRKLLFGKYEDDEDSLESLEDEEGFEGRNIYIAKWPNSDITILTAYDREEAAFILDEIADPGQAQIVPYKGSLFLDLKRKKELFKRHCYYLQGYKSKIKEQAEDKSSLQYQFIEWRKEQLFFDCYVRISTLISNNKVGSSYCSNEATFKDIPCHKAILSLNSPILKQYLMEAKDNNTNVLDLSSMFNSETAMYIIEFLYAGECFKTNDFNGLDENLLKNCLILSKQLQIVDLENYLTSLFMEINATKKSHLNWSNNNDTNTETVMKEKYWKWVAEMCNFADNNDLNNLRSYFFDKIKVSDKCEEDIHLIKQLGIENRTLEKLNKWDKKKDSYVFNEETVKTTGFRADDYTLGRSCSEDGCSLWNTIAKSFYPHSSSESNNRDGESIKESIIKDNLEHLEWIERKKNEIKDHPFATLMQEARITDLSVFLKLIGK